jgi:hypothetical protein
LNIHNCTTFLITDYPDDEEKVKENESGTKNIVKMNLFELTKNIDFTIIPRMKRTKKKKEERNMAFVKSIINKYFTIVERWGEYTQTIKRTCPLFSP